MQEWPSVVSTVSSVVGGGAICGVMHCQCDGAFLLLFWIVSRVRKGGEEGLEVMEAAVRVRHNCVGLGVRSPGSKAWLGPDIDKRATANSTLNIDTCRSLSRIHPLQRRFSPTLLPDQIKRALPEQKKTTSSPPGTWHTWWVVNVKVHSLSGRRAKRLDPARRHSSNLVRQARAWIGQGKGRKGARQRHGGWKCSPE